MGIDLPGNGSSETMHDKGDRNLIDWSMATNPLHAKKSATPACRGLMKGRTERQMALHSFIDPALHTMRAMPNDNRLSCDCICITTDNAVVIIIRPHLALCGPTKQKSKSSKNFNFLQENPSVSSVFRCQFPSSIRSQYQHLLTVNHQQRSCSMAKIHWSEKINWWRVSIADTHTPV